LFQVPTVADSTTSVESCGTLLWPPIAGPGTPACGKGARMWLHGAKAKLAPRIVSGELPHTSGAPHANVPCALPAGWASDARHRFPWARAACYQRPCVPGAHQEFWGVQSVLLRAGSQLHGQARGGLTRPPPRAASLLPGVRATSCVRQQQQSLSCPSHRALLCLSGSTTEPPFLPAASPPAHIAAHARRRLTRCTASTRTTCTASSSRRPWSLPALAPRT